MGSPAIFKGNAVKFLKNQFEMFTSFSGSFYKAFFSSTTNPNSTSVDASIGSSLYDRSGNVFIKQDDGSSTNWRNVFKSERDLLQLNGDWADENVFNTGNNATFNNGGSLVGTLSTTSTDPIDGVTSFVYTTDAALDCTNDWVSLNIPIPFGHQGNQVAYIIKYRSNLTSDVNLVVSDNANASLGTLAAADNTANAENSTFLKLVVTVPTTGTDGDSLNIGFQIQTAHGASNEFKFDLIRLTHNPNEVSNISSGGGMSVNSTVRQTLGTFTVPANTYFQGSIFAGATDANATNLRFGYSAFFDGSSGAGITTQSVNIPGWVDTVSRSSAGVYVVNYASLGLTVVPLAFATIDDQNVNNDNKSAYILSQTTTSCTIKTGDVDGDTDFDFSLQILPQGADYAGFGSDAPTIYGANFNGSVGGSVATQTVNIPGWVTSVTNNATGRFTINYSGLGLSNPPIVLLETVSGVTTSDQFTSVLTISNTEVFISQRNAAGSQNFDFNILVIPDHGDRPSQLGNLMYATNLNKTGSSVAVEEENISGWASASHLATGEVTLDYSGLQLANEPIIICTSINGAASSERDGAFVQDKSNTSAVIRRSRNNTTSVDDDTYVYLIPQGNDFAGSGIAQFNTDFSENVTLGTGSVVELDNSVLKIDEVARFEITEFDEAVISGVLFDTV